MYIVTGGAGFIGSAFVSFLNQKGISDITIVDELGSEDRWKNLVGKKFSSYIHKDEFFPALQTHKITQPISAIIHMGASSYTTELNMDHLYRNNFDYTRKLAEFALDRGIRFIYASSAAVYGDGSRGFSDSDSETAQFRPLNPYGFSKQLFDNHAIKEGWQKLIAGLRFFNVYGPNEYHKTGQFSVAYKAYLQAKHEGVVKLFKSYRPDYRDGEQKRDFVYVKDCCEVIWWLINNPNANGILNIGFGKARSWNDLCNAVFAALGQEPKIEFIEMPAELRGHYQYYTEANIERLQALGYKGAMTSVEAGVKDYIQSYLEAQVQYY
jgi:ADP-L-glycero-D-manno-heptose 6-epimerase